MLGHYFPIFHSLGCRRLLKVRQSGTANKCISFNLNHYIYKNTFPFSFLPLSSFLFLTVLFLWLFPHPGRSLVFCLALPFCVLCTWGIVWGSLKLVLGSIRTFCGTLVPVKVIIWLAGCSVCSLLSSLLLSITHKSSLQLDGQGL